MGATDRTAVIAVHGIADQRPGQTVREVARLLCHGGDGPPRYVQGETHGVLVPVSKLEPGGTASAAPMPVRYGAGAYGQPVVGRARPGTTSGFFQVQHSVSPRIWAGKANAHDLGIELNDYLLGRLSLPEGDSLYESTRISMRRRVDGSQVDLHELYWADLSRLDKGGVRAMSAMYQLFFHLGTLAADVVDQIALSTRENAMWRTLQRLHAWSAWLMKAPAALIQLCMLLIVVFGATAFVPQGQQGQLLAALFGAGAVALVALAALAWLHASSPMQRWLKLLLYLGAAASSAVATVVAIRAEGRIEMVYFGASALALSLAGGLLIERYARRAHGVRGPGYLIVGLTAATLCIEAHHLLAYVSTQREWMITAALHVGEYLLAAMLLVWAIFVLIQSGALLLGLWLGRTGDARIRASLHTSRLALVTSAALFAILSLVLWSVIGYVCGLALNELLYRPVVFGIGYRSAAIFIEGRVQSVGGLFTPLVVAFTILGAAGLLVLVPSLLEELFPSANPGRAGATSGVQIWCSRLGAWLGNGMHGLGVAFTILVPVGAIAGGVLYIAFVTGQFAELVGVPEEIANWLGGILSQFQGETLVSAGKWLAGGALTITALGARFARTFGRLRVALDAVLDIDNYFADPRNQQPPRARIFSRFASLLSHLRHSGYTRIVIVSHSQGTVICADLLRYLHVQQRLPEIVGAVPVSLVTVGSPLRDLYAKRFPLLYEWMGSGGSDFASAGPGAEALGVVEWVNACRSGDYVGRFIWTSPRDSTRFRIASVGADGKVDARRAGNRTEFCLGAGAHTHYFSNDAIALAVEIDRLVEG